MFRDICTTCQVVGGLQSDMSQSRNARRMRLGILDRGLPANEVSNTTSIRSEQDVCRDEETSGGSPSGTAKGHPIADDQGAATVVGSSSGKSMAREQSQANTSRAKAPASGQDKGKGPVTEPSGPRTQVPPTWAANSRSRPITASDIKALVENINQKIDGMATRLSIGNDRGTGNTMCFWPGVCWGTCAVLHFDTCTLTITSRGFYMVFGNTPDGVRNFISYPPGGRGALRTHCLCWP